MWESFYFDPDSETAGEKTFSEYFRFSMTTGRLRCFTALSGG
jgi:hypothetical protein